MLSKSCCSKSLRTVRAQHMWSEVTNSIISFLEVALPRNLIQFKLLVHGCLRLRSAYPRSPSLALACPCSNCSKWLKLARAIHTDCEQTISSGGFLFQESILAHACSPSLALARASSSGSWSNLKRLEVDFH